MAIVSVGDQIWAKAKVQLCREIKLRGQAHFVHHLNARFWLLILESIAQVALKLSIEV